MIKLFHLEKNKNNRLIKNSIYYSFFFTCDILCTRKWYYVYALKRGIVVGIGLILQILIFLLTDLFLADKLMFLNIIYIILGFLIILWLIKNSRSYSYTLPWIVIILLFPIVGTLLYFILGFNMYKSKTMKSIKNSEKNITKYLKQDETIRKEVKNNGRIKYITDDAKFPVTTNNDITYYPIGEEAFEEMVKELKKAKNFIFFEYFIVDHGKMWNTILEILKDKVANGVDVRIIIPGIPDKKIVYTLSESYVEPLVFGGVKIYRYTPGFVHGKVFVAGDKIATVGTINLDYRSLYLHFENGIYMENVKCIKDIKEDMLDTISKSKEITKEEAKPKIFKANLQSILRLFAPLM